MEEDINKISSIIKTHGILNTLKMLQQILEDKNDIKVTNKYIKREVSQTILEQLTENNLRMWVVDEKQSFKRIADRLGCHPDIVSNAAKKYDIKSHYTQQIRNIISNRRHIRR